MPTSPPRFEKVEEALDALSCGYDDSHRVSGVDAVRRAVAEEVARATRVRDGYPLRCQDCGAPHWFDTSIPSEIWNQIAPAGGVLCLLCIDDKMQAAGLTGEAKFYFVGHALRSCRYKEDK